MTRRGILDFLFPAEAPKTPVLDRLTGRTPAPRRPPLDGATIEVPHGGASIPVTVTVRPNARRMILRIDRRSGAAALTVPRGTGRATAERFLANYSGWLDQRLRARPARIAFAPGAMIPVRGIPHRIEHRLPFRGETRLGSEAGENLLLVHGSAEQVAARVQRFLRGEASADLALAVTRRARDLGVNHGRISVKDTTSRWGSCSTAGDLSFSWRLILAPPEILDYLVVHELAHRLEMNHSVRYWRHVKRVLPDYGEAEAWLNRHGPGLHHYG